MKKRTLTGILVILVLLILGAAYAYREFNRKAADLHNAKPVVITSTSKILEEFSRDLHSANQKYLGKVLQLNGTISEIEKDKKGFITIVLGDKALSSAVRCSFDSLDAKQATNLSATSPVTVKGICAGYTPDELGLGADLILNRCIIFN